MNKVKVGFFSFTEITDPSEHRAYNLWHQLDHLPEQYRIPGVVHGERWVSTPACAAARLVADDSLAATHYMTLYLMSEPVDATLREFSDLGYQLRSLGRFHAHRRPLLAAPHVWLDAAAARRVLVDAEAVPYRPNRGIYVVVEEPTTDDVAATDEWVRSLHLSWAPRVCEVPGVVGLWQFASSPRLQGPGWAEGARRITVCWLDDDPLETADRLRPAIEERLASPVVRCTYAGAFEAVTVGHWDWFE
jgi:hypothetical protein